eukprot:scaffold166896_cov28-Prasinocladus_malaysianus.AAC.3
MKTNISAAARLGPYLIRLGCVARKERAAAWGGHSGPDWLTSSCRGRLWPVLLRLDPGCRLIGSRSHRAVVITHLQQHRSKAERNINY